MSTYPLLPSPISFYHQMHLFLCSSNIKNLDHCLPQQSCTHAPFHCSIFQFLKPAFLPHPVGHLHVLFPVSGILPLSSPPRRAPPSNNSCFPSALGLMITFAGRKPFRTSELNQSHLIKILTALGAKATSRRAWALGTLVSVGSFPHSKTTEDRFHNWSEDKRDPDGVRCYTLLLYSFSLLFLK